MPSSVFTARPGAFGPGLRAAILLIVVLGLPLCVRAQTGLERAIAATLIVLGEGQRALGSAVLLEGGLAVSVTDVIGGRGTVDLRDAAGRVVRATVLARDVRRGLVVMRVERAGFGPGLPLTPGEAPVGTPVFALGAPLGMEIMLTRGIIAAPPRQTDPAVPLFALQHDALLHTGVAGGALVDGEGTLVGLNRTAPEGALVGMGFAISSDDLARLVPLMVAGQMREVPDLGLTLRRVTPQIAAALGVPEAGLLVDTVAPRSRAARAGIEAGDVLLGLNGTVLSRVGALSLLIEARRGDSARVHLRRGTTLLSVTLDLASAAPQLGLMTVGVAAIGRIDSYSFATLGVLFEDESRVAMVPPHSPAYAGGLRPGDRVIALNGVPVTRARLELLKIEAPVLLLVARGGVTLHVLVDPWVNAGPVAQHNRANLLDAAPHFF